MGQQGSAGPVCVVEVVVLDIRTLAVAESHLAVLSWHRRVHAQSRDEQGGRAGLYERAINHPLQHHKVLLAIELPVLDVACQFMFSERK